MPHPPPRPLSHIGSPRHCDLWLSAPSGESNTKPKKSISWLGHTDPHGCHEADLVTASPAALCSFGPRPAPQAERPLSPQFLCTVVAITLHYVHMSVFAWTFVESLHVYRMLTEARNVDAGPMRFYYVVGWGIPAIITGEDPGGPGGDRSPRGPHVTAATPEPASVKPAPPACLASSSFCTLPSRGSPSSAHPSAHTTVTLQSPLRAAAPVPCELCENWAPVC